MAERTLRQRIASGEYPAGSQLPPMDDIAAELRVSRGTVAAVLRKLAAENPPVVRVIRGYGSFVEPTGQ
jgi:DNA-binding GntR family transcriptional regulator